MRDPAPPYRGEGPHALWHVSEDSSIARFEPHVSATAESSEPRVWAVDTRHLPLYWFPRECPRGTFWTTPETAPADAELLGRREPGARRRERLARAHPLRKGGCVPPAGGNIHAPSERSAATGSAGRPSRRRSWSSSATCSGSTPSPASSSGSFRTSGRCGIGLRRRRSSSAAYASTTRCHRPRRAAASSPSPAVVGIQPAWAGPSAARRSRSVSLSRTPPSRCETSSTGSRSAVSPSQRTTAPPGSTSGRQSSAATGGLASAFASATRKRLDWLRLGSAPDDLDVRQLGREALEQLALAPLRLEQDESPVRERHGQRDARRPSARADVDDGASERLENRASAERVVQQDAPGLHRIREPRRARRGDDLLEPALEDGERSRQPASDRGKTTTKRFGSEPSLAVSTSGSSFSASWTILRSTGVIGSSATRRPVADAR